MSLFQVFSSQKLWHFASLFICCDGYPTPLKPEPSIHLPLFRRPLAYWPSALSMNYVHCAARVVKHFSTKWNNSRLLWPLFVSHKETVFFVTFKVNDLDRSEWRRSRWKCGSVTIWVFGKVAGQLLSCEADTPRNYLSKWNVWAQKLQIIIYLQNQWWRNNINF